MLAATHRHLLPLALALAAGCQGVATDGQTEVATDTFRCGHACTQLPIYTGVPTGLALTDHDTCVLRGKTPDPYFFCAGAEEIDSNGNVVHTIGNAWEFTLYDPHNPRPQSVAGGRDEVCGLVEADGVPRCTATRGTFLGSQAWDAAGIVHAQRIGVASATYSYALTAEGQLFGFYRPTPSQPLPNPLPVPMPAPVSDIGAWSADVSGKDFCALLVDGRILCGDHFVTDATTHAVITNATSIALRGSVGLALLSDERVACFGAASTHVCPARDGNVWTSAVVPQIDHAVAIAAGNDFACAKSSDGHVKCWGSNEQGQLGAGYLSGPGAWLPPVTVQIDNVYGLYAGGSHACVIRWNGDVWCWGSNDAGQLQQNNTPPVPASSNVPVLTMPNNY